MARKGNPISVRLDLNRSSDSSRFSEGDRVRQRVVRLACVLISMVIVYWVSMVLGDLFLHNFLSLAGRAFSGFVSRFLLGLEGGLALAIGFLVRALLTIFHAEGEPFWDMTTSPSESPTTSSSGNWRKFLHFSSGNEGDSAPEQSTPSAWSGSWIGRWLNQEVAPNEGGHEEATSRPTGVMEQEQAEPSQPIITKNTGWEASLRNRVLTLTRAESPFICETQKGEFWAEIQKTLGNTSSQQEYNQTLELENMDLHIRERKHECLSLFQQVILSQHALTKNLFYEPQEAFYDFFEENEKELYTAANMEERYKRELHFIDKVEQDIRERGADSGYLKDILFLN